MYQLMSPANQLEPIYVYKLKKSNMKSGLNLEKLTYYINLVFEQGLREMRNQTYILYSKL